MDEDTIANAEAYAARHQLRVLERLGIGIHGIVFAVESNTEFGPAALKVHYSPEPYLRERRVYERLRELGVSEIRGFEVPRLLDFDDELLALKITIVMPPFTLDFAGAYLDSAPEFSPEIWEEWTRKNEEQFGSDWPMARSILEELQYFGIHMLDPSPGNIRFR
ncbi:MAG TPA: hypothetical protein VHY22_07905 [Chthoniobacteraceae bacterium]|jgi:hypothetical protein|nr:hypothetical protein [Chthoniobacteraceae bacterium]